MLAVWSFLDAFKLKFKSKIRTNDLFTQSTQSEPIKNVERILFPVKIIVRIVNLNAIKLLFAFKNSLVNIFNFKLCLQGLQSVTECSNQVFRQNTFQTFFRRQFEFFPNYFTN